MRPLALYIHWPFCKSKCPYCDFNSHVRERIDEREWREALLTELRYWRPVLGEREIVSIFFGGGTPSLMAASTVEALIAEAERLWGLAENAEITLEANPTSVEAGKFRDFRQAGVNRVSLGVQALQQEALSFLGREHNAREAMAAVELAATLFPRFSFDLIYARPGQTLSTWEKELREGLTHAGRHLSLYQLTIEENTAFHHRYAKGEFSLPAEDEAARLYELTQAIMEEAGLPAYEISNHAAPGEESRHNLAYWRGEEYLGIGPGAHGRIALAGGYRYATETIKSPERWREQVTGSGTGVSVQTALTTQERFEEMLMMGLRLREGISLTALQEQTGLTLHEQASSARLASLIQHGWLRQEDGRLLATSQGMLVLNTLLKELLA